MISNARNNTPGIILIELNYDTVMNKLKATFLIICSLVSSICVCAQQRDTEATISGLRAKLANVKTSDDSIKIYYDILDLAPAGNTNPWRQRYGM